MKKKMFLFILLGTLIFSFDKAYAISGDYEHNEFKFTIEKIHLDVYKSKLSSENKFIGYEGEALQKIDVADDKKLDIEFLDEKEDEDSETPYLHEKATIATLNFDMDKEAILALLKEKGLTADKDNHYYVRMVVDYKIEKIPAPYKYFYTLSYVDKNNSIKFSTESEENSFKLENFTNLEGTLSTVFGAFEYKLEGEQEAINYSKAYEKDMPIYLDYILNGTVFSSLDETKQQYIAPDGVEVEAPEGAIVAKEKYLQSIIFSGYSNIEDYAKALTEEWFGEIQSAFDNAFNSQVVYPEEVEVPDTAMNMSNLIYIVGGLIMISGFAVIGVVLIKKKNFVK